jgi:hypothetical protein
VNVVRATRGSRPHQASLITNAQRPASDDLKSRQVRYGITMAFRVACFIAMIWVPSPYRWFLLGAAVILPYIAVIIANQADQRGQSGSFEKGAADPGPGLTRPKRRQLDWAADPLEEEERRRREEWLRQRAAQGPSGPAAEQPGESRDTRPHD